MAPAWTFREANISELGPAATFRIEGSSTWTARFTPPLFDGSGAVNVFTTGVYEEAYGPWIASPTLFIEGEGRSCLLTRGRFVVLEIKGATFGSPEQSFAANFEQWFDDSAAPMFGEIRYNSTVPLSIDTVGTDSTPDPMVLRAQSPVRAGSTVYSNWTRIYGVNTPIAVSISGGEYSLNGGPLTRRSPRLSGRARRRSHFR